MAKILDVPRKMTHTSEAEIFMGLENFFSVAPGVLEPRWSIFLTHRCLIGPPKRGYQKFWFLPQKLGFLAQKWPDLVKNGQIWPKIGIFGQILAFLAYLIPWPTKQ